MVFAGIDFIPFAIILVAMAVSGIIAARLRQPLLVGYIIAGLVIGPVGIGLVESTTLVSTLSEMGLAFLLFLIGLEMDITSFRPLFKTILTISLPLMVVLSSIGFITGIILGFPALGAVIIGIAVMYNSTAVIVKMLTDRHEETSIEGRIDMGVLLFEDIIVILIMALMTVEAASQIAFIYEAIGILVAFFIIVIGAIQIGKRIAPPIIESVAGRPEALLIVGLAWCFSAMAVTDLSGLSIEIGAFIAGVSLAQLPYTNELQEDVRPLMNLFMALFFLNFALELSTSDITGLILPAIVFGIVRMISSFVIIYSIMRRLSYSTRRSFKTAIFMIQTSEFALILGAVAATYGYVTTEIIGFLSIVTLFTMSLSSYIIMHQETVYDVFTRVFGSSSGSEKDQDDGPEEPVILIGATPVAKTIASSLADDDRHIVIVDNDPARIEELEDTRWDVVFGNIHHSELREEIGFETATAIISMIEDYDLTETLLRDAREETITVVRAQTENERDLMYADGADLVLLDHEIAGYELAVTIHELLAAEADTDE